MCLFRGKTFSRKCFPHFLVFGVDQKYLSPENDSQVNNKFTIVGRKMAYTSKAYATICISHFPKLVPPPSPPPPYPRTTTAPTIVKDSCPFHPRTTPSTSQPPSPLPCPNIPPLRRPPPTQRNLATTFPQCHLLQLLLTIVFTLSWY